MTFQIQLSSENAPDPTPAPTEVPEGVEQTTEEGSRRTAVQVTDAEKFGKAPEPESVGIPDKFIVGDEADALKSADKRTLQVLGRMAKSYAELEKRFSSRTPDPAPTETPPAGHTKPPASTELTIQPSQEEEVPEGINLSQYEQVFQEHGKLRDEDYSALEKKGIGRDTIDSYIAGQLARAETMKGKLFAVAGGEKEFTALTAWAGQNLSEGTIEAYNEAVQSGNVERAEFAIRGLMQAYTAEFGKAPNLADGDVPTAGSGDVFRSMEQLVEAQSDPRYGKDPAYTKDVMAKVKRSPALMGK